MSSTSGTTRSISSLKATATVWLAAQGALEDALCYVRTTARPWTGSGAERAVDDPYILEHFGVLSAQLSAARALADESGALLDRAAERGPELSAEERGAAAVAVYEAKLHATRVALEVTQKDLN